MSVGAFVGTCAYVFESESACVYICMYAIRTHVRTYLCVCAT